MKGLLKYFIWLLLFAPALSFAQIREMPHRTIRAPEFPEGLTWLNTDKPLSLRQLRGKFVLLDFWTYCCINCLHIIPDLKKLEEKYADELVVIGVHSAKFPNEGEEENIRQAILRYGITHPVVNDREFIVWRQYAARAWPSLYLIDPEGYLVGYKTGEGVFEPFDRELQRLIPTYEARGTLDRRPLTFVLETNQAQDHVLAFPGKVFADPTTQRLFISDTNHHRIVIADVTGQILETIGSGEPGLKDGSYETAQFRQPQGLWYDASTQTLYVADTENHALRRIDLAAGKVHTLAGTGEQARWGIRTAGPGEPLNSPWDILLHDHHLYVAMAGSHQLWVFHPESGEGEVFAGSGYENLVDGPRHEAQLAQPSGLATDGTYLYFADSETSAIRRVPLLPHEGKVETLIGKGLFDFGDREGPAKKALLQHPLGVAYTDGEVFIADTYNHKIKALTLSTQQVTTRAGTGKPGFKDGVGAKAQLYEPGGLSVIGDKLYIADTNNHAIRILDRATGSLQTLRLFEVVPGSEEIAPTTYATVQIKPGETPLHIQWALPEGFKLNPQYAGILEITLQNEGVSSSFSATPDAESMLLPLKQGAGVLTIQGKVVYCKEDETQCKLAPIHVQIPLEITPATPTDKLNIPITVES